MKRLVFVCVIFAHFGLKAQNADEDKWRKYMKRIDSIKVQFPRDSNECYLFQNAVYIEVAGNAQALISINYERNFISNCTSKINFAARAGVGWLTNKYDQKSMYSIPLEGILLLGGRRHYLESGIGWTSILGTSDLKDTLIPQYAKSNYDYMLVFKLGYRFSSEEGLFIRIGPVEIMERNLANNKRIEFRTSFGVSFGYNF